jgi:hypothetical protein
MKVFGISDRESLCIGLEHANQIIPFDKGGLAFMAFC